MFPDSNDISKIDLLVQNALSTKTSASTNKLHETEEEIDKLFYKIYDLTSEEIQLIESSTKWATITKAKEPETYIRQVMISLLSFHAQK